MQEDTQIETLIAKFYSGEASPEEAMQLEDWAEISPENRTYLNTSTNFLMMNLELNTIESRQHTWENIKNVVDKNVAHGGRLIKLRWMSVAATLALILSVSLLAYTFFNTQNKETTYHAESVARIISLMDNSKIVIQPNSSITLDKGYGTTNRKIRLKGSADFSVIHDATRPFIIDMNKIHIKDLGTAFSVKTSPEAKFIFIHVTEGEVVVYDDSAYSKQLKAGERAIYSQFTESVNKLHLVHFEPAKGATAPEAKNSKMVQDTTTKKKSDLKRSPADTSAKSYRYKYSTDYPLDKSYTPEDQEALLDRANKTTKRILADMIKDGLVENGESVSFKLSDKGFSINGEKQSEAVFRRYEKKYSPVMNTTGVWSWTYNSND